MRKILLLIALSLSASSFALENISFRAGTMIYQGTSNEIVYRYSGSEDKLSELIWEDEMTLYGFGATYDFNEQIKINGDLFTTTSYSGEGEMEDYDWMDYNITDWTHWSNSKTKSKGTMLDINIEVVMLPFFLGELYLVAGYKYDYVKSEDYEGNYIYSSAYNTVDVGDDSSSGFRDLSGSFTNKGITYVRYFNAPYFGLGLRNDNEIFIISTRVIYSTSVSADDEDTHHNRDLFFEESFEDGTMLSANINGKFKITDSFAVTGKVDYTEYFLIKGSTTVTNLSTGAITIYGDESSGIEHSQLLASLGIEIKI